MDDLFSVGVITTAHGVHGEVKVFPTTDDANRFKKCKELLLDTGKELKPVKPVSVKFFKNLVILKLEGINTMDDALLYKGKTLYVTRENAVKCEKDEYFIADLIGLKVIDEDEKELGTISDVLQTGANDVYEVTMPGDKTFLMPAIKECILEVKVSEGYIKIHLMDGLI